jgi:hypothetical protein
MQFVRAQSVPANGTSFPLQESGSVMEIIKFPALLEIALVQASGAVGGILATIYSGTDLLCEESPISAAARFPVYPDDFAWRDEAAPPDRLRIALRNTTGGAIVVNCVVKFNPIV